MITDKRVRDAAPKLLDALRGAVTWVSKLSDWAGADDPPIEQWQAAIALAVEAETTTPSDPRP